MKNIIIKKDGPFSTDGGVLTSGDVNAYKVVIDMGTDTSSMTAMAICQENGEFSEDYFADGTKIGVVLTNSMYKDEGFITVRLAVSDGNSVLTAKEIVFRVATANNAQTIAETQQGTISHILTAVQQSRNAAENSVNISSQALAISKSKADADNVYSKDEIDSKIASVYRYKGSVYDYRDIPSSPSVGDTYNVANDCMFPMAVFPVTITGVYDFWDDAEWIDIDFAENDALNTIVESLGSVNIRLYDTNGNYLGSGDKHHDETFHLRDYVIPNPGQYYLRFEDADAYEYHTALANILKVNEGDNVAWTGTEWDILSGTVDLSAYATREDIASVIPTLKYTDSKTIHLGNNVLGSATLGEGWSESNGTYTHAKGSVADLTFETSVEEGSVYLLEFDTSYTAGEYVRVGIGDRYRILCYKGSQAHATIPLLASGGTTLYISPYNDTYAGSISNITLKKIQDNGTECVLDVYTVETNNHDKNYGFWNTLIGDDTAENAVGSTRTVAIGTYALRDLQGGHRNIGIGTFAMSQLIGGESNISIGADSMLAVQKADECIALGLASLYEGSSRKNDIAIGVSALRGTPESTTEKNIAIGYEAGRDVTTAKSNILVGNASGLKITSGVNNTFIGSNAGKAGTTCYNCVAIGHDADVHAVGAGQVVVIGSGAKSTKSKQVVIGSDAIVETLLKGNLVIRGTDGVMRQIVFNADGTCSWTTV